MKFYIFDTDIAGFVQKEHPKVIARIAALGDEDTFATTVVTFGEDLSGWLPACRRAVDGVSRTQAYKRLLDGLDFYREMIVIPFDEIAAKIFDQLKAQKSVSAQTILQLRRSRFQSTVFSSRAIS